MPPTDFDFNDQARRRQPRPNALADFFSRALATFLGTLLAGLILLVVRAYWIWSVQSVLQEMKTFPSAPTTIPPLDLGKGRK